MKIGTRNIGAGQACYVIAEAGLNHNGDVSVAKLIVDVAVLAGADAVKFQKRDLASLYRGSDLSEVVAREQQLQYVLPQLEENELAAEEFVALKKYCDEKGIVFMCTPWDVSSADFVASLGVPAFKTASADMTNEVLLEHLCEKGLPLIVSTGMSSEGEIERAVEFLKSRGAEFALLHCNSTYPASFDELNLRCIPAMREKYGVPVGYSGHERGYAAVLAAVALGASVVEKHVTLDRTMRGPDHPASLEPDEFIAMMKDIRIVERSLGVARRWMTRGEYMNREALGKSLVAARDIAKGATIERRMITTRSPGKGVSPQRLEELEGCVARRAIATDDYFVEGDFGGERERLEVPDFALPWGLIVRFKDVAEMVKFGPGLVEFHLTEGDLRDYSVQGEYSQRLAVHMAEYVGENLVDLCSRDGAMRRRSIERIDEVNALARAIAPHFDGSRAPRIVLHPGGMSFAPEPRHAKALLDNLADSLERVDSRGVEMLVENMPPLPWYFGGQWHHNVFVEAGEIARFCERTGLGLCLDISHAQLACNFLGCCLAEYARTLRPFTRHVHVADAAGLSGEGLQIGEGEVDFGEILDILRGIDGFFIPEIWQGHKFGGEGFIVGLRRLAEIMQVRCE